ncbi:hypothetical protein O9K51_10187 [Purpureocillium lavendulum]|uniref:Uncharacterized protein n=1 Tax=Purpureocillium lavendulum TaxID=1247861 RepID=A0AB34FFP0_9HYPO|nr:hypothetical protein O9K51_10187 [Purpureocillium lavendulum]
MSILPEVLIHTSFGFGKPALSAIRMQKAKFYGGVIVNETSQFEVVLDPNSPRYVGHPTRELDAAWDQLVGKLFLRKYVALTKSEAEKIGGHVSEDGGAYFVVTHVRHSLHCVNYLRKVAYEKWYPTIRHEDKPTVPTFWQHVGLGVAAVSRSLPLDHTWANHQKCLDIGGPRTFQPEQQPSLIVNFATGGEGLVSIVAFELGDEHLGGIRAPGSSKVSALTCM